MARPALWFRRSPAGFWHGCGTRRLDRPERRKPRSRSGAFHVGFCVWHPQRDSNPCRHHESAVLVSDEAHAGHADQYRRERGWFGGAVRLCGIAPGSAGDLARIWPGRFDVGAAGFEPTTSASRSLSGRTPTTVGGHCRRSRPPYERRRSSPEGRGRGVDAGCDLESVRRRAHDCRSASSAVTGPTTPRRSLPRRLDRVEAAHSGDWR
jgi:hypothetical protein